MKVEQFVMAYEAEQDRIRALLPEGFVSLRPVLRINAELRDGMPYLEFNTPVEHAGVRGWLNIAHWDGETITWRKEGSTTTFSTPFVEISFRGVGVVGGCPAEKDNAGCFFLGKAQDFRPAEQITANKEFCDCCFSWKFAPTDARGVSQGKTLPAFATQPQTAYPRLPLTAQNAAAIPCRQVLGTYMVTFERNCGLTNASVGHA